MMYRDRAINGMCLSKINTEDFTLWNCCNNTIIEHLIFKYNNDGCIKIYNIQDLEDVSCGGTFTLLIFPFPNISTLLLLYTAIQK